MAQLTVRDVPEDVAAALKAEAEERGVSVSRVLREALADRAARQVRIKDALERLRIVDEHRDAIRARLGHDLDDSTLLIREDRDSR